MFGSVGLFRSEIMFGLIVRGELFLKVGDANRPMYEAAGEAPFSYDTEQESHTIRSYWRCPPDLLDVSVLAKPSSGGGRCRGPRQAEAAAQAQHP